MTFWGHLSVDYNLFEVVCPCGITAYDLLRSFVCVEYQLMTFWGHLSVDYNLVEYQLMTFWGRLSVRVTSSWPSEVVCLCGISDYDLFEVICPCGIPAYDLLRSFVCAEYQLMTFWDFFFVPIILLEGWSLVSPFSIWEFMMDCIPFPDLHDYGEGQRG